MVSWHGNPAVQSLLPLYYYIVHGEGVWPHEKHHMTCISESSHYLSPLSSSGCGQYLNVVFHTVMVTLLYLCGDVEKNPGPPCELSDINTGEWEAEIIPPPPKKKITYQVGKKI